MKEHGHAQKKGTLIIVPGWMHTSREWAQAAKQLPEWDVHVVDLPGFGVEPLVSTDWGVPEYAGFVTTKLVSKNLLSQRSSGRFAQPDHLFEKFSDTLNTREQRKRTDVQATKLSEKSLAERPQQGARETEDFLKKDFIADSPQSPNLFVFLGHSFGGRVLAHIFGTQNESAPHADALILYAAPCLYRPRFITRARRVAARAAHMLRIATLLPETWKPYDLRQATDAGLGAIFKRSVGYDQTAAIKNITVPTHLLWGAHDTSVPLRIAEEIQRLIPGAQLTTLPNEGHNIHLDNPGLFYGALRRILSAL